MKFDSKLSGLLSDFFLDIAKASFIAAFVTPALSATTSVSGVMLVLIRGLLNVILYLYLAWLLAGQKGKL